MENIVYRNYDKYVMKHLLKDIGAHRMRLECENRKQNFPKRLSLFFIEANHHCTFLKYNYPVKGICAVMNIDRYELPQAGWVRVILR